MAQYAASVKHYLYQDFDEKLALKFLLNQPVNAIYVIDILRYIVYHRGRNDT